MNLGTHSLCCILLFRSKEQFLSTLKGRKVHRIAHARRERSLRVTFRASVVELPYWRAHLHFIHCHHPGFHGLPKLILDHKGYGEHFLWVLRSFPMTYPSTPKSCFRSTTSNLTISYSLLDLGISLSSIMFHLLDKIFTILMLMPQ